MQVERKPIDAAAASLMVLLCACWGIGHVAAKVAAQGIPLVLQSGLRGLVGTGLVLAWCAWRRIPLRVSDGTLGPGLLAGILFGLEFLCIFAGLRTTDAARMGVFIYLAPCMTALGLHFLLPSERLRPLQWAGIAVAFAGVAAAFGEGFASGRGTLAGDLLGVLGAFFWALTTVIVRTTRLGPAPPAKTLLYQLAVSGPMLVALSWLMGEPDVGTVTPLVAAAFAYQCVVVVFASFLAWFWLMTRYLAAPLSVFTFLTPLFSILGGVLLLGEPISALFLLSAALVLAGIFLVNRRA